MAPSHPVWRICLENLGPNLAEAAELADVLQEVSAHIQVTGLTRTLTARTSTSSGNLTHLSTKERIRRALPLNIDAGSVPWSQLVAVVSSAALQEPTSPAGRMQPQVLEVNSGGAVYFLFFKLQPQQQQPAQQRLQTQQQQPVQDGQQHSGPARQQGQPDAQSAQVSQCQQQEQQLPLQAFANPPVDQQQKAPDIQPCEPASAVPVSAQQQQAAAPQLRQQQPQLPLLQLHEQRTTAREGVAVLKVGASRLAMQAEQFANELTRHLGIAAPDCRIVRQVGLSATEWSAVLAAVQHLADPQQSTAARSDSSSSSSNINAPSPLHQGVAGPAAAAVGTSAAISGAAGSSSVGCQVAAELLAELLHLPCFLLMEFVEGSKLSDCPHAVDPAASDVGQLCEDVGRLFLLDMLLGNADRMSCPELGWRGNANNLLYAQSGSRHAGRAVAIDSCVARRPPALKASAEDAAVERLSQLVLAVPEVSLALLQQLLGALRQKQQQQQQRRRQASLPGAVGVCTQLSMESFGASCSGQAGDFGSRITSSAGNGPLLHERIAQSSSAAIGGAEQQSHADHCQSAAAKGAEIDSKQHQLGPNQLQLPLLGQPRVCKTSLGAARAQGRLQDAAGTSDEARFTEDEVARFQAGLRQCLEGVLQIKGLLEMVSAKIAEWIAEFVEDVVQQNPALLPTPPSPSPGSHMRSPKPSPRVSGRGSFSSIRLEPAAQGTTSSGSPGGLPDAVATGTAGTQSPGKYAGSGVVGSSFSSRLQAAAVAVPGGGSAGGGGVGPGRLQPTKSLEPTILHNSSPLTRSQRGLSAEAPAAAGDGASQGAAATHGGAAAGSSGSSSNEFAGTPPKGAPPRGLLKQFMGGQKSGKTPQPLSCRFAAIKAAICSPKHSSSRSSGAFQHQAADPTSPTPGAPAPLDAADNPCTPPPPAAGRSSGHAMDSDSKQQQQQQHTGMLCSPPHSSDGSRCGPGGARYPLDGARATSSDLATAVAAALSPRANAVQAEALAGVFGGGVSNRRLCKSLNGAVQQLDRAGQNSFEGHSIGGHSIGRHSLNSVTVWCKTETGEVDKPLCARRVTWCAADEPTAGAVTVAVFGSGSSSSRRASGGRLLKAADGTSALKLPGAAKCTHPASAVGAGCTQCAACEPLPVPAGWSGSPSIGLRPAAGAKLQGINGSSSNSANSSRNSSSSPGPGPGQASQLGAGREAAQGLPGLTSPTPGGVDSLLNRQHNTRHLSFTNGAGGGDGASSSSNSPAGVAASMQAHHQQQQQRSSSSSLQVLASLQLDATLASITQEARHDGALAERLAHWKRAFREKGGELSGAIASWQQRHQLAAVLSTGFLDGSHPIVDAYELGVRLQHMLRRLTALAAGALVQVPIMVLPGVFLGNAVAADSHHLLQYLGVTHILNAAQELQLTSDSGMFHVLRVAIRDEEEEDVTTHFQLAQSWIDAALASGGAVLVHCHEGKSRSVTLLLAYLMISRGQTLAAALAHMRAVHPKASPNAGFMAQLMRLDRQLHGTCSIQPSEMPRAKPEARICSICGAAAGISYESLVRHTKAKHGLANPPLTAAAGSAGSAAAAPA